MLINDGSSVIARSGGGTMVGPGAVRVAEEFVHWVDTIELQLVNLSLDLDLVESLHTSRYWRIRQLHEEPVRPVALVQAEIDRQTRWLRALRDDLARRAANAARAGGAPVVLDTNVLLEYMPPDQIDWLAVVNAAAVRLVVPLRVIEELDELKYDRRRQQRADRARGILPRIGSWVGDGGEPARLRDNTTIEVLVPPAPRYRPLDGDEEILHSCHELEQFGTEPVTLVSADTAMRLRAQGLEISVVSLPSQYERSAA